MLLTYVGVRAGARLLDKHDPGWEMRINTKRLNIADGWYCVLGQLYSSYGTGLRRLNILHSWRMYGFISAFPETATALWIREINNRLTKRREQHDDQRSDDLAEVAQRAARRIGQAA